MLDYIKSQRGQTMQPKEFVETVNLNVFTRQHLNYNTPLISKLNNGIIYFTLILFKYIY